MIIYVCCFHSSILTIIIHLSDLVMENGEISLDKLVSEPLPQDLILFISAQIFLALNYLHSNKFVLQLLRQFILMLSTSTFMIFSFSIIHRDIKPENFVSTTTGHIKLIDFGSAKRFSSPSYDPNSAQASDAQALASEHRESFVGSPLYVSPEMLENKPATSASDVWAAGVILFVLLQRGRHPFASRDMVEFRIFQNITSLHVDWGADSLWGLTDDTSSIPSNDHDAENAEPLSAEFLQRGRALTSLLRRR